MFSKSAKKAVSTWELVYKIPAEFVELDFAKYWLNQVKSVYTSMEVDWVVDSELRVMIGNISVLTSVIEVLKFCQLLRVEIEVSFGKKIVRVVLGSDNESVEVDKLGWFQ
jgi:hypothetical protein